ncbi:HNH endonuclease signature motif containing protein [Streptomyces niger]|uniref:HNH endonuclease signature motif containing protein n=1 Tax=Streptomyces niger TaxID=66373 RepID=UPI00069A0F20|nr:HNH endonuclease signature motif containing protein [Streptomyces niger]
MPSSPYTHARLSQAAAASRTLSEALRHLGVDPKGPSRRYLRTRMKALGIDTSHFEREGTRWTKEVLEAAVTASTSVYEVLHHLGLDPVGGNHAHISRRLRALGIDTSHFGAGGRTKRTSHRRRTIEELLVEQDPANARRADPDRLKLAMLNRGVSERCSLCGTGMLWRGCPLPLEVDHIDGNWRNNRLENLRLLCPNCHSTTDSYRGRNKRGQSSWAGVPR